MKCSNHNQIDAIATCVFCGRALCSSCITQSASGRAVCSPACSSKIAITEAALHSLQSKSIAGIKRVAFFALSAGLLFAGIGVHDFIEAMSGGSWILATLSGGLGVILIIWGISAALSLRKKT